MKPILLLLSAITAFTLSGYAQKTYPADAVVARFGALENKNVATIADTITAPFPAKADKARAIFYWIANQIALAVERGLLAEETQQAELRIEAEQLRSPLLSSVSHDLRTPLPSITGPPSTWGPAGATPDGARRKDRAGASPREPDALTHPGTTRLDITLAP